MINVCESMFYVPRTQVVLSTANLRETTNGRSSNRIHRLRSLHMRLQVGPGKVQEVAVGVVACAQTCVHDKR